MIIKKSVERTGWFFNFPKLNDSLLKAMQDLGYRKIILPDRRNWVDKKLLVYPGFLKNPTQEIAQEGLLNKTSACTRWPVPRILLMKNENLNRRSLIQKILCSPHKRSSERKQGKG
jgi:hypothetical protein